MITVEVSVASSITSGTSDGTEGRNPVIFDLCEPEFPYDSEPLAMPLYNGVSADQLRGAVMLHYVGPDAFGARDTDVVVSPVVDSTISRAVLADDVSVTAAWDAERTLYRITTAAEVVGAEPHEQDGAVHTFTYDVETVDEATGDRTVRHVVETHTVGAPVSRNVDGYSLLRDEMCALAF